MKNSKKLNNQLLISFALAILLILVIVINMSFAYFTDTKTVTTKSGEIKFGTIAIKVSVAEEANYIIENGKVRFTISADEVACDTVCRTLVIENVDGKQTEDFAIRLAASSSLPKKITTSVSETKSDSYANSINMIRSNWLNGTDNKLYFNKFVSIPEGKKIYIPIKISFDTSLSLQDLENKTYVIVDLDIIQAANNGYLSWEGKPTGLNITETYIAN